MNSASHYAGEHWSSIVQTGREETGWTEAGQPRWLSLSSTGSSVILPLDHTDGFNQVEVMVCGGAISGAYSAATRGRYLNGLKSCGRMVITGNENEWKMEEMLDLHLLNEMLVLPTGNFLIINRWKQGCAGFNSTKSFPPTLTFTNRKEDQEEGFQSLHPQQSQECILRWLFFSLTGGF